MGALYPRGVSGMQGRLRVLRSRFEVLEPRTLLAAVTLDPAQVFQTMGQPVGPEGVRCGVWEATAWAGETSSPAFDNYIDELLQTAVDELGIDRVRLEIRSGAENQRDFWSEWQDAGAPGSPDPAYVAWRAARYSTVNDNDDPLVIDWAGFQFSELDNTIEKVILPLREKLRQAGKELYVNVNYVSFNTQITDPAYDYHHTRDPEEYAELVLATYQHMQTRYGFVPDSWEVILEPENTGTGVSGGSSWPKWTAGYIAQSIVAAGQRLEAAGFQPRFVAPSNVNAGNTASWATTIAQYPGALDYFDEISYHLYGGNTIGNRQNIAAVAGQYGLNTAQLEKMGATHHDLYNDLVYGNNSSWATFTFRDYINVDESDPDNPVVSIKPEARLLRQTMHYVRAGAVRIGAGSDDSNFAPVAFVNPDGGHVVAVKTATGGSISVDGLPAGIYGISYTTPSQYDVHLADVTVAAGQTVDAAIPRDGVLTVFRKNPPGESLRLDFSTFIGGGDFDRAQGCFVDKAGYIYLGGNTASADFPVTPGAYDTSHNGQSGGTNSRQDGFVAKLTPDGSQLVWATFLGGSDRDQVYGVRVDDQGYVYAVGVTSSSDFPTTAGAYDRSFNGGSYGDVFAAKLSPDGASLVYSTFVGGSSPDGSRGDMFLAADGSLYVSGQTQSSDFPTTAGVYQQSFQGGSQDAFVFKLSADGASLEFATYLGGSGDEHALSGVFVLDDGSIVTAGATDSSDFPTTPGAYQTTFGGGSGGGAFGGDAFITRLTPDASGLVFSTFLGGSGNDPGIHNQGLAVDASGRAILTGDTTSPDFPVTAGAFQTGPGGGIDGFVSRLSRDGSTLEASTYLAGSSDKEMSGIMVDARGNVYVSGNTQSVDYPVTADAFQPDYGGGDTEVMFTKLSPDLSTLLYSTYLGGTGVGSWGDRGRCVWLDPTGGVIVSGDTNSADFPVTAGAYQETYGGGSKDGFLARFAPAPALAGSLQFSVATQSVVEAGGTVTVTVTRTGGARGEVSVDYATADGTATEGEDYQPAAGTLTWADGDTADKTFTVTILDDTASEGDETIEVRLSNPTGGVVLGQPALSHVVISDDDVSLRAGLAGHWLMDDAAGPTAADSSGYGNDGTLIGGPVWTTGRRLGGLQLDGQDDYVDVPDAASLNPTSQVTLAAWVNSSDPSAAGMVVAKGDLGGQYHLRLFQDKVRFGLSTEGTISHYEPAYAFAADTWYHLAAVYDGATMRVYVNGNEVGPGQPKTGEITGTDGIGAAVGKRSGSTINYFPGTIDDLRIYNRALSPTEIGLLASDWSAWLDVDDNGTADALTDGVIILRYLFGFTGDALTGDAIGINPPAQRNDPAQIITFLDARRDTMLDVDANGTADALTDGILVLRRLFGFTGAALVQETLAPDATRTDPGDIVDFLNQFHSGVQGTSSLALAPLDGASVDTASTSTPTGAKRVDAVWGKSPQGEWNDGWLSANQARRTSLYRALAYDAVQSRGKVKKDPHPEADEVDLLMLQRD